MAREVVEQIAHLADVDDVERQVVEVRVARLDERHDVVLGVDVEPDAGVAEPRAQPSALALSVPVAVPVPIPVPVAVSVAISVSSAAASRSDAPP